MQQATSGNVTGEKPMWAETGGLDFDGRERWEAWAKLKVRERARGVLLCDVTERTLAGCEPRGGEEAVLRSLCARHVA